MSQTAHAAQLAQGWIDRYESIERHGDQSPEATATYQAFEQFEDAVGRDPELAWSAILHVIEQSESDFVLENLAAGPLETLIGRHSPLFIDRIERRAAVDERFRWLLGGVWQGLIPADIWERIKAAQGPDVSSTP
jgi:hypothetical protein